LVPTLGQGLPILVPAVPAEAVRAGTKPRLVEERANDLSLVVDDRQRQRVGSPEPERDLRRALRAVAGGRERTADLRAGDRVRLELQILRDDERDRRGGEQQEDQKGAEMGSQRWASVVSRSRL
jgi:hypothetical protein